MSFHHNPEFHRIIMQDKKLRVPKKYVENYWKRISNPIFLTFPNGMEQKIFWEKKNDDIYFGKHWVDFSKPLKYGNLLTFKHIGGSHFKVKIFGVNTLEINYSILKSIEDGEKVSEDDASKEFIEVSYDDSEEDGFEDETKSENESEDEFEDESDDETDDDEFEIVKKPQRTRSSKRKIHVDMASSSNRGGNVKKAKKYPRSEAFDIREIGRNPFFKVKLTRYYATGHFMMLPSKFSREHLNKFVGTAMLQVGKDIPMEVSVKFDGQNRRSTIMRGWKSFRETYDLEIGDSCKFLMIRRRPPVFSVVIDRVMKGPNPKKLHGRSKLGGNWWKKGN